MEIDAPVDVGQDFVLSDQNMHFRVGAHYSAEARLLQQRQFREWLTEMVAPDIHYWMPVLELRMSRDRRPQPSIDDAAIFNDRYEDLRQRIERLYTGLVWMEDPPSRIRYFISNIQVFEAGSGELKVFSNVLVIRNRRQTEMTQHSIGREDLLRIDGDRFWLVSRRLELDARVTQDKNLYFFA
jgi:3-phenylpropionate/cinnamic acid dioxygenase small subunit